VNGNLPEDHFRCRLGIKKMKITTASIILCALIATTSGLAEQNVFDLRSEQSLRPHDFDVEHYRIALTLDADTQSFDGETTITFSSIVAGLEALVLNAVSFKVERVTDDHGKNLAFSQNEGALAISLEQALEENETAILTISYAASDIGIDKTVGLDFRSKSETNPQLVNSLNWPNGARYWFPSFDHPSDWASHETIITTKSAYRVVANGTLVSDTVDHDSGLRTVHWHQTRPQPTYLYAFAAGPYSVLEDKHGDLPLHYWVYPSDETVAVDAFAKTPEIIAFYENLYGRDFPWEKYDQIIVPGIGGGAESTSATLLGRRVIQLQRDGDKGASDWLLAHEIAHQWWGDLIGYRDWTHAWMAESFASDGEYLFILDDGGADAGALYLLDYKDSYLKEAHEQFIRPIVTNKWDKPNDMFDRHGYEKGAVVLNMFRDLVGTDTYDEILSRFLAKHAYSNVTTDDFLEMVKEVTGKDYDWFFDQWLLSPGHPVLAVSFAWDANTKKLVLTIRQTQNTNAGVPIFRLPIKIGITTSTGKNIESVWLTEQLQSFEFDVALQPLMVRFDEGDILLKEWSLDKPVSELMYQLEHDNVIGRLWAISNLQRHSDAPPVRSSLQAVAEQDAAEAVREAARALLSAQEKD
jgi:aminopeptidase N